MKAITACTRQLGIGYQGEMPWHIKEELQLFRQITTGNTVIMGRKTFQSIGHKELPNRRNIILTRDMGYDIEYGVECAHSKSSIIDSDDIFIIGGAEIYSLFLDQITDFYISFIKSDYKTDTKLSFKPEKVFDDHEVIFENRHFITYKFFQNNRLKGSSI
tara:strand:- start:828 stop:1307 length:480 start_codon:yes stop_codon:yes gene_type:complete